MSWEMIGKDDMPVHIQTGKENKVAVVFSCPGRHEEKAGYPAAKNTGRNLEILLSLLSRELNRSDLARENITVTNAWPVVEYLEKSGRSEATVKEVKGPENLRRLQQELDDITDFVIFCGKKAAAAAKDLHLKHNPKFVYIRHPGLRGLSLIAADLDGERIVAADICGSAVSREARRELRARNNERRIAVVAGSVVRQLRGEDGGFAKA